MSIENFVFVGGPGRSGTSMVADRLGNHGEIAAFKDIELKILFERDGLFDLRSILTQDFSPNRATVASNRFRDLMMALRKGGFGQFLLAGSHVDDRLNEALAAFDARIKPEGIAMPMTKGAFNAAARDLLGALAGIAAATKPEARLFLEKTPHNLLAPQFLHELAPQARFIHVVRDPRATAVSLLSQTWGPKTLPTAILWVKSYFQAWFDSARQVYDQFGLDMLDIHIEDLSENSTEYSTKICDFLGVERRADLFSAAASSVLDRWKAKVSEDDLALLDRMMEQEMAQLGYSRN
jgi:hypothetical protein